MNLDILNGYKFDIPQAISEKGGTALRPGSEFKPPDILEGLFIHHPLWNRMKMILVTNEATLHLDLISEEE